jgi:hypothetical protein
VDLKAKRAEGKKNPQIETLEFIFGAFFPFILFE